MEDTSTLDLITFKQDKGVLEQEISELVLAFQSKHQVQVSRIQWGISRELTKVGPIYAYDLSVKCEI